MIYFAIMIIKKKTTKKLQQNNLDWSFLKCLLISMLYVFSLQHNQSAITGNHKVLAVYIKKKKINELTLNCFRRYSLPATEHTAEYEDLDY